MAKYERRRSARRSTPRHSIAVSSTAEPPDPMPCALAAILLPASRARGCHMQRGLCVGVVRASPWGAGRRGVFSRCGVGHVWAIGLVRRPVALSGLLHQSRLGHNVTARYGTGTLRKGS
jgi:hypothetical protein